MTRYRHLHPPVPLPPASGSGSVTLTFDANTADTWTAPSGVTTVAVTCGSTTDNAYAVTPGSVYAITLGASTSFNGSGVTGGAGNVTLTYTYNPGVISGVSPGSGYLNTMAAMSPSALAASIAAMKLAGVTYIRVDSAWYQGNSVTTVAGPYDAIIAAALAGGLNVIVLLHDSSVSNTNYSGPWGTGAGTFTAWCSAAATHYKAMGCHTYEIGNEVNLVQHWSSGTCSPSQYAACFVAAAANIRAVDAAAIIGTSGLSPATPPTGSTSSSTSNINPQDFIDAMYVNSIAGHMDWVGIHLYTWGDLGDGYTDGGYPAEVNTYNTFSYLTHIHATMNTNGDGSKKIWNTESGAPVGTTNSHSTLVTAYMQATTIGLGMQLWASLSYSGSYLVYNWTDASDGGYGLYTAAGVARPSLAVFAAMSGGSVPIAPPPPTPGTPVLATPSISGTTATFTWSAASNADHYKLILDGTTLAGSVTTTSWVQTGVATGSHTAQVYAVNSVGVAGSDSNTQSFTVSGGAVPDAPATINGVTVPTTVVFNDGFAGPNLDFVHWTPGYYYDGNVSAGPFGAGNAIKGNHVAIVPGGVQLSITGSLGSAQIGVITTCNTGGIGSGPWVANQPTGTTTSGSGNGFVGFTFSPAGGGTLGTAGPIYIEYEFTGTAGGGGIADWTQSWLVATPQTATQAQYIDEIDVVETGPNCYGHVHYNDYSGSALIANENLAPNTPQTVGCLWTTGFVTIVYNGVIQGTYTIPSGMASLVSGLVLAMTDANGNGGGHVYPATGVWRRVTVWQG